MRPHLHPVQQITQSIFTRYIYNLHSPIDIRKRIYLNYVPYISMLF